MTDLLRDTLEQMTSGEPPLRTGADTIVRDARQRQARRRSAQTVAGLIVTVIGVAGVLGLPRLLTPGEVGGKPTVGTSQTPSAQRSPTPEALSTCGPPVLITGGPQDQPDGTVLPDPHKAAAALLAAAPRIAPELTFRLVNAGRVETHARRPGIPSVWMTFYLEDRAGVSQLDISVLPEPGAPIDRANIDRKSSNVYTCYRQEFPDGSVAQYVPFGNAEADHDVLNTFYYSPRGFTMQVACDRRAYLPVPVTEEPTLSTPTGTPHDRPPVTTAQIFALAAAAASA